jgi:DNA-binding beta-propeller fold protein YncE
LWVASEARTLTRIDLVTHATEAIGGVGIPTAISYGGGSLWVAQGYDGRVVRVDASTLQLGDDVGLHARRLASSADALWVTDDLADRVVRISMRTLKEEGALALDVGSGPHGIAIDTHSVWVANERTATLIQIDEVSLTTIGHVIGLGSAPTQLALGGGSLWVTSMDFDRLYRVDVEQGRVTATLDTCDGPDAVVASDQAVWVACRIGHVVRRFAIDGSATKDIEVPGVPAALVLDDDGVWVAIRGD